MLGSIQIIRYITLSDPNRKINFPIVREAGRQRLLTGGDFDIESLQRASDGSFWIGEEFGPFLLHVDRAGTGPVPTPVPSPLGKSPQNPLLGETTPRTQAERRVRGDRHVSQRALPVPDPGEGTRR